jgi:predicted DNA-binding protein (MmcQ/YjbR family)
MTLERMRAICLKFPQTTEQVQWGDNLVFKVCGKIFAIASLGVRLDGAGNAVAFKCTPEDFALLIECEGMIPAPYLARAHWVSVETFDILSAAELTRRLRESYDLVVAGLPKMRRPT